jgi:hypothetical protein
VLKIEGNFSRLRARLAHLVGHLLTVNGEVFSQALALFASEVGAGTDKQIVLLLDGAGWHKSATLRHPVTVPPAVFARGPAGFAALAALQ